MAFHDVRLDPQISHGAKGGPSWRTTVITTGSGFESRNSEWARPKAKWDVSHILESAQKRADLLAFFHARRGSAHGFRFKDWIDYYVGMGFPNGVIEYTGYQQFATGNGSATTFQLTKTYSDGGGSFVRKITRPVSGTVKIYVGGVLQASGVTINYSTGVVTFASAPANAALIQWAGQFDVPVRFMSDEMDIDILCPTYGEWGSIGIVEIWE